MNYLTFPFGKYKGHFIDELPNNYICYALGNMDLPIELNEALKRVLIQNLNLFDIIVTEDEDLSSTLKVSYRQMCKKYHPDSGGSDYAMQVINEFYNLLK